MEYLHNKKLTPIARTLRRNSTKEESHLWYDFLKSYPVRFRRQHVIGSYVVDFYCSKARIVIELDGSQHYEDDGLKKDASRNAFLEAKGLKVFHISNKELSENFIGVCEYIDQIVKSSVDIP